MVFFHITRKAKLKFLLSKNFTFVRVFLDHTESKTKIFSFDFFCPCDMALMEEKEKGAGGPRSTAIWLVSGLAYICHYPKKAEYLKLLHSLDVMIHITQSGLKNCEESPT